MTPKYWTKDRDDKLRRLSANHEANEIADIFGKSSKAIRNRLIRLGLRKMAVAPKSNTPRRHRAKVVSNQFVERPTPSMPFVPIGRD